MDRDGMTLVAQFQNLERRIILGEQGGKQALSEWVENVSPLEALRFLEAYSDWILAVAEATA